MKFLMTFVDFHMNNEVIRIANRFGALFMIASFAVLFRTLSSPRAKEYARKFWKIFAVVSVAAVIVFIFDELYQNNVTAFLSSLFSTIFFYGCGCYVLWQVYVIRRRVPPATMTKYQGSLDDIIVAVRRQVDKMKSDAPNL